MKLFAVMYLKGHLAAAMFLWNGATVLDCETINSRYLLSISKEHPKELANVRMACEWHKENPVKDPVRNK